MQLHLLFCSVTSVKIALVASLLNSARPGTHQSINGHREARNYKSEREREREKKKEEKVKTHCHWHTDLVSLYLCVCQWNSVLSILVQVSVSKVQLYLTLTNQLIICKLGQVDCVCVYHLSPSSSLHFFSLSLPLSQGIKVTNQLKLGTKVTLNRTAIIATCDFHVYVGCKSSHIRKIIFFCVSLLSLSSCVCMCVCLCLCKKLRKWIPTLAAP